MIHTRCDFVKIGRINIIFSVRLLNIINYYFANNNIVRIVRMNKLINSYFFFYNIILSFVFGFSSYVENTLSGVRVSPIKIYAQSSRRAYVENSAKEFGTSYYYYYYIILFSRVRYIILRLNVQHMILIV